MMTVMMTMMVMMIIITDHHHDRLLSVDIVFCGCLCVHSLTMDINSFLYSDDDSDDDNDGDDGNNH